MRQKAILFAWVACHCLLIATISARDICSLVARGLTIAPSSLVQLARKAKSLGSSVLGQNLASSSNPVRRGVLTYLQLAGIDRGYGYFAPNVPVSYRLVFEVRHANGEVEEVLPSVQSDAAALRVASLLDEIGRTRHDGLREYIIKAASRPIWRERSDVTNVRAIFGINTLPSIAEFEQGSRGDFELLYTYDFSLRESAAESHSKE